MSDVPADRLPEYDELLHRTDAPRGSAWGLWGTDDQLGALNLLTDERTAAAGWVGRWVLDQLAEECARDGSYAFMLVPVPLNLRGAIGSPPQAVAVR